MTTTPLMDRFAVELLTARSATEAYRRAYEPSPDASPGSIHVAAHRLRHHPAVVARYEELLHARVAPTIPQFSPTEAAAILEELQRLAAEQEPA